MAQQNNPYFVQPSTGQALAGLGNAITRGVLQERQQAEQAAAQERQQSVIAEGDALLAANDVLGLQSFMLKNPEVGKRIQGAMKFKDDISKQNATDTAFEILDGQNADAALLERAEFIKNQGGDPAQTLSMVGAPPEQQQRFASMLAAANATPEQLKNISILGAKSGGSEKVGAQEILEDGTVIQSTPTGTKVYSPTGELVKGQAAADTIRLARAEKVANLRKTAGEKKMATLEAQNELEGEVAAGVISQKEAANASIKAFDKIEAINDKIALYDEGIALIDEGAGTGRIEKMLPSFKAASVKLDNLANRLGLDVVGNTTFGALSAGELAMAMSTALPTGLDGPELREWLVEKKESQEKLADYLESAAIYLGTPGNTKVGWIKKKKRDRDLKGSAPVSDKENSFTSQSGISFTVE